MKKIIASLLVASIMMAVCSCGFGKKKTELTVDNIEDYLSFSVSCDGDVGSENGSVRGLYYSSYSGDATAYIEITNQTGAHFENVTLTLDVHTVSFYSSRNGMVCGWEFTNGNIGDVDRNTNIADAISTKLITVNLPYDGDWDTTERLELVLYGEWSDLVITPSEPNVYVRVVDVSGYVVED